MFDCVFSLDTSHGVWSTLDSTMRGFLMSSSDSLRPIGVNIKTSCTGVSVDSMFTGFESIVNKTRASKP
jgi:hypothetical protein